jgi:hypothetical protein
MLAMRSIATRARVVAPVGESPRAENGVVAALTGPLCILSVRAVDAAVGRGRGGLASRATDRRAIQPKRSVSPDFGERGVLDRLAQIAPKVHSC